MDKTKEYIKQCDCLEIQGLAPNVEELELDRTSHDRDYVSYFYLPRENKVELLKWDNDCRQPMIGEYNDSHEDAIWLPRQDQLQEMLGGYEETLALLMNYFGDPCDSLGNRDGLSINNDYFNRFTSMEQLWLAFYMKEKYNKVWDGKNWE